jgi:hypothetical protein
VVDEVDGNEGELREVAEDRFGIEGGRPTQRRPHGGGANDIGFGDSLRRMAWLADGSSSMMMQRRMRRPPRVQEGSSSVLGAEERRGASRAQAEQRRSAARWSGGKISEEEKGDLASMIAHERRWIRTAGE